MFQDTTNGWIQFGFWVLSGVILIGSVLLIGRIPWVTRIAGRIPRDEVHLFLIGGAIMGPFTITVVGVFVFEFSNHFLEYYWPRPRPSPPAMWGDKHEK